MFYAQVVFNSCDCYYRNLIGIHFVSAWFRNCLYKQWRNIYLVLLPKLPLPLQRLLRPLKQLPLLLVTHPLLADGTPVAIIIIIIDLWILVKAMIIILPRRGVVWVVGMSSEEACCLIAISSLSLQCSMNEHVCTCFIKKVGELWAVSLNHFSCFKKY